MLRQTVDELFVCCFPDGLYARTWLTQCADKFATYEEFEAAFRTHFVSSNSDLVSAQVQWTRIKQRNNDTVKQYNQRLLELKNLLGQLGHTVSEHEETSRFVEGLHETLRRKIVEKRLENPSLTHQQLVSLAVTLESSTRLVKESTPAPARDPALAAIQATLAALNIKDFRKKRCWYCKKTGHTADECKLIAKKKANGTWKDLPPKNQQ